MRILDSKDEGDRAVVAEAPLLHDHLNQASRGLLRPGRRRAWRRARHRLRLSPRLVRGLDYYTHTAFEFTTTALGAQGAVMAGGRYDGLMREMGGPDVPGRRLGCRGSSGWRCCWPRRRPRRAPVAIVPIGAEAEARALALAHELRRAGVAVELAFKGKPGQRMKRADRIGARWAVFLGERRAGARRGASCATWTAAREEELALRRAGGSARRLT